MELEAKPEPAPSIGALAPPPASVTPIWRPAALALEFLGIFVGIPTLYWQGAIPMSLIPAICAFAGLCLILLLTDRSFDRKRLWNPRGVIGALPSMLVRLAILGGMLTAVVAILAPEFLLHLPRRDLGLYVAIMLLYPIFSVYPQELAFRALVFHRYRSIFPRPWIRIGVSALVFGYAHILFGQYPALSIALSATGGLLFGITYERSKSLLAAWLEHSLWGDLIWTIGLGMFFYAGGGM